MCLYIFETISIWLFILWLSGMEDPQLKFLKLAYLLYSLRQQYISFLLELLT